MKKILALGFSVAALSFTVNASSYAQVATCTDASTQVLKLLGFLKDPSAPEVSTTYNQDQIEAKLEAYDKQYGGFDEVEQKLTSDRFIEDYKSQGKFEAEATRDLQKALKPALPTADQLNANQLLKILQNTQIAESKDQADQDFWLVNFMTADVDSIVEYRKRVHSDVGLFSGATGLRAAVITKDGDISSIRITVEHPPSEEGYKLIGSYSIEFGMQDDHCVLINSSMFRTGLFMDEDEYVNLNLDTCSTFQNLSLLSDQATAQDLEAIIPALAKTDRITSEYDIKSRYLDDPKSEIKSVNDTIQAQKKACNLFKDYLGSGRPSPRSTLPPSNPRFDALQKSLLSI